MSGWDPAATALLQRPAAGRAGAAAGGDLRALAHGAGRPGPAAGPAAAPTGRTAAGSRPWSTGSPASRCHRHSAARSPPRSNQLREGRPETAAQVLSQLVAPAREAGGAEAGDALAQAARAARAAVRADLTLAHASATVTRRDHEASLEAAGRHGSTRSRPARRRPTRCRAGSPRSTGCSAAGSGGRTWSCWGATWKREVRARPRPWRFGPRGPACRRSISPAR